MTPRLRFSWILVAALTVITACVDETVPTATNGQTQAAAPVITDIEASELGKGVLRLQVRATDPNNSLLSFTWRVDKGSLSANSGQTVIWTLPTDAGTYAVTVEGENTAKQRATATRRVQVAGDGTATATGQLEVSTGGGNGNNPAVSNGQFQIATPVPVGQSSVLIVGSNPSAAPLPQATPSPPFQQPVATPAPGATGTPGTPVGQPIATPTPTTPPPTPAPSPTPTARPGTPEPGVPEPPPSRWQRFDPAKVPTTLTLHKVHFTSPTRGWAVGKNGTVLFYNQTDPNVQPSWVFRNNGVSNIIDIHQVHFVSDTTGFIAGNGLVMRTLDAGVTWQDITPPGFDSTVQAMIIYNGQIGVVANWNGKVFRSQSLNAANAANVAWTTIDTRPAGRSNDHVSVLNGGTAFSTTADTTVAWFAGDNGIFRLDSDAAPDQVWRKMLQLSASDGQGNVVAMDSANDIWVGTSTGIIVKSSDAGNNWNRITNFVNREFNGNTRTFDLNGFNDLEMMDTNVVFGLAPDFIDTANGGATWKKQDAVNFLFDMQIEERMNNGFREFFGWGVGQTGIYFYIPQEP